MALYLCIYAIIFLVPFVFPDFIFRAGVLPLTLSKKSAERKDKGKYFVWISFALIFFMFALRHQSMGVDLGYGKTYTGYLWAFERINTYSWAEVLGLESFLNYEKGYVVFMKLVGSFWNNKQFFLAVCAFCSVFPVAAVIRRKSPDVTFSFFIYMALPVFTLVFSGLRQAIALGLCFYAMLFVEEQKPIRFVLTVFLACFFHFSAILFYVVYPLYWIKTNFQLRLLTVLALPVVFIFRVPLFKIAGPFLGAYEPDYNGATTLMLVFIAIYVVASSYFEWNDKVSRYLNIFYVACVVQIFGNISSVASRVGYYFMMVLILMLPQAIEDYSGKDITLGMQYIEGSVSCGEMLRNPERTNSIGFKMAVKAVIVLFFCAWGVVNLYTTSWACSNPYYWFWQNIG